MVKPILLIAALMLSTVAPANAADFPDGSLDLTLNSKSISKAVTGGGNTRGPSLALLRRSLTSKSGQDVTEYRHWRRLWHTPLKWENEGNHFRRRFNTKATSPSPIRLQEAGSGTISVDNPFTMMLSYCNARLPWAESLGAQP